MKCRRVSDINPYIDAREVLQRAEGTPAGSTMLLKFLMRARTDRKESSWSMSKASRVLEWLSSTSPDGGGTDDHQDQCVTGPQQRKTADASPRGQSEASGHPQKRAGTGWGYLQARSAQQWEEATQLELPWKTQRQNERKPPTGEKSEQGTGCGPYVLACAVPPLDERR